MVEERHKIEKRSTFYDYIVDEEKKTIIKHSISLALNAACVFIGITCKSPSTVVFGGVWGAISLKKVIDSLQKISKIELELIEEEKKEEKKERGL